MAPATQFELSQPPTDAVSSVKFAPETPTRLLVASWDKHVYLYDTSDQETSGKLLMKFQHRAPVLDVCFGIDDNEAYTGSVDFQVNRLSLLTGEKTVLSTHGAPVKSVVYSRECSLLFSASWDSTLHVHDLKTPNQKVIKIILPAKPHSLSITASKLVVAMSSRLVHIYELYPIRLAFQQQQGSTTDSFEPWQQRESSLKFMTRSVACMPNDAGYATSSIEGRIAVEWFDPSPESQARKYAFKCHRQPDSDDGCDIVYPVNAVTFHPIHGTFASGGGDGIVALWDAEAKRRIRQYQKYPSSIAALSFSCDGKYLAVGVCPGFENDSKEYSGEGVTHVFIRELGENEAKGKRNK